VTGRPSVDGNTETPTCRSNALTIITVRPGLWYIVEGQRWGMFGAGQTTADLPLFRMLLEAIRIRIQTIPTE